MEKPIEHIAETLPSLAKLMLESVKETAWPTRCAGCDSPGVLLCCSCARSLSYIDWWRACPLCGAPYGRTQCTECNSSPLASLGLTALPFDQAASATTLDRLSHQLITVFKDAGEQRLSSIIASILARYINPSWINEADCIAFIPATKRSLCARGFDHCQLIANDFGSIIGLPVTSLFERPQSSDQRRLSRKERFQNMSGCIEVMARERVPRSVLLIDDVCTTGATLYAASQRLRDNGVRTIRCITFARAW